MVRNGDTAGSAASFRSVAAFWRPAAAGRPPPTTRSVPVPKNGHDDPAPRLLARHRRSGGAHVRYRRVTGVHRAEGLAGPTRRYLFTVAMLAGTSSLPILAAIGSGSATVNDGTPPAGSAPFVPPATGGLVVPLPTPPQDGPTSTGPAGWRRLLDPGARSDGPDPENATPPYRPTLPEAPHPAPTRPASQEPATPPAPGPSTPGPSPTEPTPGPSDPGPEPTDPTTGPTGPTPEPTPEPTDPGSPSATPDPSPSASLSPSPSPAPEPPPSPSPTGEPSTSPGATGEPSPSPSPSPEPEPAPEPEPRGSSSPTR